jgi:23S rRNA pseudouridine1911/1915/1917 synthase
MEPRIIYEDKDFLAVEKPAGLIVHNAKAQTRKGMSEASLADWILLRYPEVRMVGDDPSERPGIVHRLDKETSGILLVARTQSGFEYLKSEFQKHEVRKTYLAVVIGAPKESRGTIDKPIGIKDGSVKRSIHSAKMRKEAITEYEVKKSTEIGSEVFSLLEVRPKTGRTHQIRVHCASLGCPIAGDGLYGRRTKHVFGRMMLHAWSLEFNAPNGERLHIATEIPSGFITFGA